MKKKLSLIEKIEQAGLSGRGGAGYPTALKWKVVKTFLNKTNHGYIIVNAAEGEPGVKKDGYLLEKESQFVIEGVNLAFHYLGKAKIKQVYFYINHDYYYKYQARIEKVLKEKKYFDLAHKFQFFLKPSQPSYIGGEESAILNIIEGKRAEPRLRPPFPAQSGLFKKPTLINNVETLYDIALINNDIYKNERLYTIGGRVNNKGVYSFPADFSVEDILRATNNFPNFPFFVITGGEVCGEVLNKDQLTAPVEGSCLIMVFDKNKTDLNKLLNYWLKFYTGESCGACTACREGSYRLQELFLNKELNTELFKDLLDNLEESSLCALGSSLPLTIKSYLENVYHQ